MNNLTILSTAIHQVDGLYSLNDLHRASGGAEKHNPNRFIRLEQTKALISAINQTPDMALAMKTNRGGRNSGTYGSKELVLSYGMWISPQVNLAVIRAFLNQQESSLNRQQSTITISYAEYTALLKDKISLLSSPKEIPGSPLHHRQQQQKEKQHAGFIQQVKQIIRSNPGINKKDLLAKAGFDKRDKTRNQLLDMYEGIHWKSQIVSNVYSYQLIAIH